MGNSRNRIRRAGFLSGLLLASQAMADPVPLGPPIPLAPPDSAQDQTSPDQTTADQTAAPERQAPQGIVVDQLAPPDPAAMGALGAKERPLPARMWQGATRSTVVDLLPHLAPSLLPAVQSLTLRLLASPAAPPPGDGPATAFLALRAERLTTVLGRTDSARTLLQAVPTADRNEPTGEIAADLAFLDADAPAACTTVGGRDHGWQGGFWDEAQAACDAMNGQESAARLDLDVLHESKAKDDGYQTLIELVLGDKEKPPDGLPQPQAISLALFGRLGLPLAKKALDSADLAVLRAVALGAGFPLDQRLAAAEKAAAYGALPPDRLGEAYLAMPFQQEDRDEPLTRSKAAGGAFGRAILFNAARDATSPVARANFLATLLERAPVPDVWFATVRAAADMLTQLPPQPDLGSVAPDFARALYALDRPREAGIWLGLADPDETALVRQVARLAGAPASGFDDARFAGTRPEDRKRTALLAALLDAEAGPGIPADGGEIEPGIGAAVLAALAGLGDDPAAPAAIAQAIGRLRSVGLDADARQLAVDAAIAAGF